MDQLPRLGKRELICLLSFTCNYVVFVWRGFLFLWVLGMGYVILLWHSLNLPYNYFEYCSSVWSNTSSGNINRITKLQRHACKLILSQDYIDSQEALKRLSILSFDQVIFLNKAKLMYKVYNNIALVYLHELFQMRDINLDNTTSNLRSVAHKNYLLPQAKCNLHKGSFSYSGVVVWNSLPAGIIIEYIC